MFKKLLPLIAVFALLATYAGYRAVDARASTLAANAVTSLDSAPAAYIASANAAQAGRLEMGAVTSLDSAPAAYLAWAQAVENGPMDPATNLPTTADAALWTRYLFARYGEGCCGLTR